MADWSWENAPDAEGHGLQLIGHAVRRRRYAAGLSQQQLAWKSGTNQSTISRLERGLMRSLRVATLARILAVLDAGARFELPGGPPPPSRRLPALRE